MPEQTLHELHFSALITTLHYLYVCLYNFLLQRQAEDCLRIEKLRLFGEYLCGVEPPMLGYSVESGTYFSVAPEPCRSEEKLVPDVGNVGDASGDEVSLQ